MLVEEAVRQRKQRNSGGNVEEIKRGAVALVCGGCKRSQGKRFESFQVEGKKIPKLRKSAAGARYIGPDEQKWSVVSE